MKNVFKLAVLSLSVVFAASGCRKSFLDRKPTDQANTQEVFKTIDGFEAAVQGIHRKMYEVTDHDKFGYPSLALTFDLMGEDLIPSAPGAKWFLTVYAYFDARSGSNLGDYMWTFHYSIINNANQILSRIDALDASQNRKDYVKASALFYRAYAYYNLSTCFMHTYAGTTAMARQNIPDPINYSGPYKGAPCVPLYTAPTQIPNPRATVEQVYTQITSDLTQAIDLFKASNKSRSDKSELNESVAKGLYARVALVMQNWTLAATMAHEARQDYPYMNSANLLYDGFTDVRNAEWIWGSIINAEQSGIYASFLSHLDYDLNGYAALGMQKKMNSKFMATSGELAIPDSDLRRKWWWSREELNGKNLPYTPNAQRKFHPSTPSSFAGDFPLMRAAEMGLIEAEALAQNGQAAQSAIVLTEFAITRNPNFVAPASAADLVKEIWKQRRIELWGEGFRFADLMRSFAVPVNRNMIGLDRTATGASSQLAGGFMSRTPFSTEFLWRIPASEINVNKTIPQNP